MKISFCTTCKNRGYHLQETLPVNMRMVPPQKYAGRVEFLILDYDGEDGIGDWLKAEYPDLIASGYIRVVREENQPVFRMAHAKNLAHAAASGDIVVNLDADNFLGGERFVEYLTDLFARHPAAVVLPRRMSFAGFLWERYGRKFSGVGRPDVGIMGRIAIARDRFAAIGGYDEEIRGWGADDIEFALAARDRGCIPVFLPRRFWGRAIPHSDEERVQHIDGDMSRFQENGLTVIANRWRQFRRRDR